MASKKELLEQRRQAREQSKISAISSTETVLDILTNESEEKADNEKKESEAEKTDTEKSATKKKSPKNKNEKMKSKLNLLEPDEKRSVQHSIYLKPSTYNELQELLSAIKENNPNCGIKTFSDLVNEIIKNFLEEQETGGIG